MHVTTSIVWLRRDLRLDDNVALEHAARTSDRVVCAFILDPELLRGERVGAPIVSFFFDALAELRGDLYALGSDLALLEGDPAVQLHTLAAHVQASALFFNRDYDPSALARDARVSETLRRENIHVSSFTDHVYYAPNEVLKEDGDPYLVFTPFKHRWLRRHEQDPRPPVDSPGAVKGKLASTNAIGTTLSVPSPQHYGHKRSPHFPRGGAVRAHEMLQAFIENRIDAYADDRNFPARAGTSLLSAHLRAGTIGIRTCMAAASEARIATKPIHRIGYDTWISELIWRDFFHHILAHFPHVATEPFIEAAKPMRFPHNEEAFQAWCEGRTGYPIIDAAILHLNTYGWMHNRLRMIVASFLSKHLLLDYRLGERYFEQHLVDADLAANNGGWQWAASTGVDAAPFFRVFNPVIQSEKFDPEGAFIKTMLPALANLDAKAIHAPWILPPEQARARGVRLGHDYPEPIVEHLQARNRAVVFYATMDKQLAEVPHARPIIVAP
jgi:deoxyribodipyrimidine photo-lyase